MKEDLTQEFSIPISVWTRLLEVEGIVRIGKLEYSGDKVPLIVQ